MSQASRPHSERLREAFNAACEDWQLRNKYLADRPAWYHDGHDALDGLIEQLEAETFRADANRETINQLQPLMRRDKQRLRDLEEQLEAKKFLIDGVRTEHFAEFVRFPDGTWHHLEFHEAASSPASDRHEYLEPSDAGEPGL